jgi:hypothetical protein
MNAPTTIRTTPCQDFAARAHPASETVRLVRMLLNILKSARSVFGGLFNVIDHQDSGKPGPRRGDGEHDDQTQLMLDCKILIARLPRACAYLFTIWARLNSLELMRSLACSAACTFT